MKSIRFWLTSFLISLVLLVTITISFFFYWEFRQSLDDRVLLQLTSIRNLKSVQIKNLIQMEWDRFNENPANFEGDNQSNNFHEPCISEFIIPDLASGIYDVTECNNRHETKLLFYQTTPSDTFYYFLSGDEIQQILLERTGMGQSGETYIVGNDSRLRSDSRFFSDIIPYTIINTSRGVAAGINGNSGGEIIEDYRGVKVYSSYAPLKLNNLDWVILSEMDVEEVMIPLRELQRQLFLIFFVVVTFAVILSVLISRVLSRPILFVRNELKKMTYGNFLSYQYSKVLPREFVEMIQALEELKVSISGAIYFSQNLGLMNLQTAYQTSGKEDALGKSLLKMQEKLLEYKSLESETLKKSQKLLIKGQEQERERLSKELHDGIGPLLTGLKLLFQTEEDYETLKDKAINLIDQTIGDVRRMTYDLMPPAIRDFGVGKALIHFTNLIARTTGIDIQYSDETKNFDSNISNDLGVCLFRIVQELVNNTIKHAKADLIRISLTEFEDYCSLYYSDNGKGFNPEEVKKGSGLRNIQQRIDVFNGEYSLQSDSEGTIVEIEIPINV